MKSLSMRINLKIRHRSRTCEIETFSAQNEARGSLSANKIWSVQVVFEQVDKQQSEKGYDTYIHVRIHL